MVNIVKVEWETAYSANVYYIGVEKENGIEVIDHGTTVYRPGQLLHPDPQMIKTIYSTEDSLSFSFWEAAKELARQRNECEDILTHHKMRDAYSIVSQRDGVYQTHSGKLILVKNYNVRYYHGNGEWSYTPDVTLEKFLMDELKKTSVYPVYVAGLPYDMVD